MRSNTWMAALLLGASALGSVLPQDSQEPAVELTRMDDLYVLRIDEHGAPLLEFLELASRELHVSMRFTRSELASTRLDALGPTRFPVDQLRAFVETTLREVGYQLIETRWGDEVLLEIVSNRRPPSLSSDRRTEPIRSACRVALVDLETWRNRQLEIAVILPVVHIEARHAMTTLNPLLDPSMTTVRSVESNNVLLIVGPAETVRQAVAMVRGFDVPGEAFQGVRQLREEVADLGRQVLELEQRLSELESR